jgi:hypothetical protein
MRHDEKRTGARPPVSQSTRSSYIYEHYKNIAHIDGKKTVVSVPKSANIVDELRQLSEQASRLKLDAAREQLDLKSRAKEMEDANQRVKIQIEAILNLNPGTEKDRPSPEDYLPKLKDKVSSTEEKFEEKKKSYEKKAEEYQRRFPAEEKENDIEPNSDPEQEARFETPRDNPGLEKLKETDDYLQVGQSAVDQRTKPGSPQREQAQALLDTADLALEVADQAYVEAHFSEGDELIDKTMGLIDTALDVVNGMLNPIQIVKDTINDAKTLITGKDSTGREVSAWERALAAGSLLANALPGAGRAVSKTAKLLFKVAGKTGAKAAKASRTIVAAIKKSDDELKQISHAAGNAVGEVTDNVISEATKAGLKSSEEMSDAINWSKRLGSNVEDVAKATKAGFWKVDSALQKADEVAGVIVNGKYIKNPNAQMVTDILTDSGK